MYLALLIDAHRADGARMDKPNSLAAQSSVIATKEQWGIFYWYRSFRLLNKTPFDSWAGIKPEFHLLQESLKI